MVLNKNKDVVSTGLSQDLSKDIEAWQIEVSELTLLYRDKKITYKFLAERIKEIFLYIKEDIREQLHN